MTNEEYLEFKPELDALSDDEIKSPHRKVEKDLVDFKRIALQALNDKEALVASGFDATCLDTIDTKIDALAYTDAKWTVDTDNRNRSTQEWKDCSEEGFNLQAKLDHIFSFAFKGDVALKERVAELKEGDTNADMIHDLQSYAIMGKDNPSYLEAVNFDMTQLDTALELNAKLSTILAENQMSKADKNELIAYRNRAYTLAKQGITYIKEYASFVFWQDKEKLKIYEYSA